MCQSMMFKLVSLGVAISGEPLVDLRNLWKKMTLQEGIKDELSHPQRALVTRGRILMLEGQERFFSFLLSCSKHVPATPLSRELTELLCTTPLPIYLEDQAFIRHFYRMEPA